MPGDAFCLVLAKALFFRPAGGAGGGVEEVVAGAVEEDADAQGDALLQRARRLFGDFVPGTGCALRVLGRPLAALSLPVA